VCRALLVESAAGKVLLETGIGSFFPPKLKDRYGVVESEHVLLSSLAQAGLTDADVDFVILSHLHFDHAGGLLAPYREGHPPQLLFPNARFVVGGQALERARAPHRRDRASFIDELPQLLEGSGRLLVVEQDSFESTALGPKFRFSESNGHTPGMLNTELVGARASVFFCADLIPGVPWLHLPITMGYDRFPEKLIDEKLELYERALGKPLGLFFTHDPNVALSFLSRDERGRYGAGQSFPALDGWDLDEAAAPAAG
jgi:glyoxylase-like metal-dependent hydrolase (beta-lactamase superfamily II)